MARAIHRGVVALGPAAAVAPMAPAGSGQMTIARACAPDIERFCAGVPPRQGMIKQCMKAHVTELSAGCFDAVMSAVAAQQAP
jgi:Cysteine rich repeat